MKKALIIYRTLPQYRIDFYNSLKEELYKKNIILDLIYGDSHYDSRRDTVHCDWATFKRNKIINFGAFKAIWQPCLKEAASADLVIVEQANSLLINYILMARRAFTSKKLAFWGHGLNLQDAKNSFFNKFKLTYIKRVDWWFAYTENVKKFLVENGYNAQKVTATLNAIDTKKLNDFYKSIDEAEVITLKEQLGIKDCETVFIYCGALYKEKRIDFMIDALAMLNKKGYKFKFLLVGSGPLDDFVAKAASENDWLINAGPKFGREKALYFRAADIFLQPGAMGLGVLDSFAFETPMIAAESAFHGPEFEYLVNDYNGIISSGKLEDYVNDIAALVSSPEKYNYIKSNCKLMVDKYNNEVMVANFTEGICSVLNS